MFTFFNHIRYTLSVLPGLFDKLVKVGDQTRENELGSPVSSVRLEISSIQNSDNICSRILGQLGQSQRVLRDGLWALRPLRIKLVPRADDVTVKALIQAGACWVRGFHCTGGHLQIRSETYLEDGGRSEQREVSLSERHWTMPGS